MSVTSSAHLIAKYYEHVGLLPTKHQVKKMQMEIDKKEGA